MLGEMAQRLAMREAKRGGATGWRASQCSMRGARRQRRARNLHVVAVVVVVRRRGLHAHRVAVLRMQRLDLGRPPPVQLAQG